MKTRDYLLGWLTCFYLLNRLYKQDSLEAMDNEVLFALYNNHHNHYRKV